ncbi:MAG: phosphopantetheine-binding protein [Pseudomonadota bacterium]
MSISIEQKQQIIKFVASFAKVEESAIENSITLKDLQIDELDLVRLTIELEEMLNIEISEEELKTIRTIKDILSLVNTKF